MKTTKDKMCAKGVELFKIKGFENVTVSDICEACNVTRGSFYHHFNDKYDLLHYWNVACADLAFVQLSASRSLNSYEALYLVHNRYIEQLVNVGHELLYAACRMPELNGGTTYLLSMPNVDTPRGHFVSRVVSMIEDAQRDGYISDKISSYQLHLHYNLALIGLIIEWHHVNGKFNFVEEANKLFYTIIR